MGVWESLCQKRDYNSEDTPQAIIDYDDTIEGSENFTWKKICRENDYSPGALRDKDIVIFLQSRDNPARMNEAICDMLAKADSFGNFDIVGLVDQDQMGLYADIIKANDHVIWIHPPHTPGSWTVLKKVQHSFVIAHDYYFNWTMGHDQASFVPGWDTRIIEKRGFFDDGLFVLTHGYRRPGAPPASSGHWLGRQGWIFESCYLPGNISTAQLSSCPSQCRLPQSNSIPDVARCIFHYCELLPIFTKEWIRFMDPIFRTGNYSSQHDAIAASIAMVLKRDYDLNRVVVNTGSFSESFVAGFDPRQQRPGGGSGAIYDVVEGGQQLNRDQSFWKWSIEDEFKISREVAKKMYWYIKDQGLLRRRSRRHSLGEVPMSSKIAG